MTLQVIERVAEGWSKKSIYKDTSYLKLSLFYVTNAHRVRENSVQTRVPDEVAPLFRDKATTLETFKIQTNQQKNGFVLLV